MKVAKRGNTRGVLALLVVTELESLYTYFRQDGIVYWINVPDMESKSSIRN